MTLTFFHRLLQNLDKFGVAYVMVGTEGFNQWVPTGQSGIETQDGDLLIKSGARNIENILAAVNAAKKRSETPEVLATDSHTVKVIDYATPASRKKWAKWLVLNPWILVIGFPDFAYSFEMIREISGFTYEDVAKDAVWLDRQGAPAHVAQLAKILRSKQLADRPKDQTFFKVYAGLIDDAARMAKAFQRSDLPKVPRTFRTKSRRPK